MTDEVDDAVDVYTKYSKIPSLDRARIQNDSLEGYISIYSEWTQKDLDRFENIKIGRSINVHLNDVISNLSIDIGSVQHNSQSPTGLFQAILRKTKSKDDDKQFIEIWSKECKLLNIDVSTIEQHGPIYEDGEFGCWSWSYHETHLLYVAEKKRVKAKSFFDKKAKLDEEKSLEDSVRGLEFIHLDNWGEQLADKSHPVLCVLDVESGIVSTIHNLPDDVSPAQPIWCPDDLGIICVGRYHEPYRLGAIYCPIRKSDLFHINLKRYDFAVLTKGDRAIRCPRFSPDHTKLVYLDSEIGGAHHHCSRLVLCDWSTKGLVPVIDIIKSPSSFFDSFPGIFTDKLRHRCWSADSKRVIFQTNWMSRRELVVVDVTSGNLTRLTNKDNTSAWSLLDIKDDLILASASSPNMEPTLMLGLLPSEGLEHSIQWTSLSNSIYGDIGIKWHIQTLHPDGIESISDKYQYIILESINTNTKKPLIVIPHGGPNSVITPEYSLGLTSFIHLGFSILLINYRGSTGYGENNITSLLGKIGSQDVKDCHNAVLHAVENYSIDEKDICLYGGSHGGFLTLHLIGQYPGFYKVAAVRNPVVDLVSMLSMSDIPDWCMSQSGLNFDFFQKRDVNTYSELAEKSPIKYVEQIKTPLLIMVGKDDLRVPPQQSMMLFKALKALNKNVKMLSYPGCNHPISKVDCEADAFVNSVKWFLEN